MFFSYVGIRVTNLERSVRFYEDVLALKVLKAGDFGAGGGKCVLKGDPVPGQRIELNWYPEGSKYATKYVPDEGLDRIGVKVASVAEKLKQLAAKGVEVVDIPGSLATQEPSETFTLHIGFVKDPDGIWIGLYDHPDGLAAFTPGAY